MRNIFGFKNTMDNFIQPEKNIYPYGAFRALNFDIRDLDPESFGPHRLPPLERLILDETRHNQVVQVCLNGYAKLANQEAGFTGVVNYCAIGSGADAPDIGDVTLQTETARTTMVALSNVRTNNSLSMSFYFGPSVGNGDVKEVGGFVDGTSVADSGTLFDRAAFDFAKTSLNALFFYFTQTFSA